MEGWKDFNFFGTKYGLGHLAPLDIVYALPPSITSKAKKVRARATFGIHCFTRDPLPGEVHSPQAVYFNNPEKRLFCDVRWQLSSKLPGIIDSLATRSCYETEQDNFVTLSIATPMGPTEYAVFFSVSSAITDDNYDAFVFVHSAYIKPNYRPHKKKSFAQILGAGATKLR